MKYESFVKNPVTAVCRIQKALGMAADESNHGGLLAGQVTVTGQHTVAGNPIRLTEGTIELRLDDAWIGGLPARDRLLVTAIAWPLLAGYGYLEGDSRLGLG